MNWFGLFTFAKYKSMLLHLKKFISVSRYFFETIIKAKERLYPTSTGKKLLYFSPKYMENGSFLILLQLVYCSFNLAI